MRAASDALIALLATRQFFTADLYEFTLVDGTVLRYTSNDVDIGAYSSALGWERTLAKWSVGLIVDTMDVTMHATPDQLLNDVPIIETIAAGDWDGALCTVSRAFMPTPGDDSAGSTPIFIGWIGDISEIGRIHCKFQLQSRLALLNVGLPRALFGPPCRHVLFGPGCTLDRGTFTATGADAGGSTASVIQSGETPAAIIAAPASGPSLSDSGASGVNLPVPTTYYVTATYTTAYGETIQSPETSHTVTNSGNLLHVASPAGATGATGWNAYIGLSPGDGQMQNGAPIAIGTGFTIAAAGVYFNGQTAPQNSSNGYYALGVIKFTSGANAGRRRVIETNDGGAMTLRVPFPVAPEAGDTYEVTPGCDHSMATCLNKFSNLIHFGGEPFIPTPEQASA